MNLDKISIGELPDKVTNVVEVPQDSSVKYELDKDSGAVVVDRFIYPGMVYPANYGFIPHTLADDGDPLDILTISSKTVAPGSILPSRIIGMLVMEDDSGLDEKILAVPTAKIDPDMKDINSLEDLPDIVKQRIEHFFTHYKELEPGKWVKIQGFAGKEEAVKKIEETIKAYKG